MVYRVIPAAQNQQNIETLRKTKSELARCRYQVSTGKKGETYADLKEQTASFLREKHVQQKIELYIKNNTSVDIRLEKMELTIGTLMDVAKRFQEFLVSCRGTMVPPGAKYMAANILGQTIDQINSQDMDGRYIFAGTRTNIAPVDLSTMTTSPSSNSIDTSYYTGDSTILKTNLDSSEPLSYGVLASDPAFESLIRSLRIANDLNYASMDLTAYGAALNAVQSSLRSLETLFAQIGENRARIIQVNKMHQDTLQLVNATLEEKIGVDQAEVLTQISRLNDQINSSYYAINQLNNLSFLRFMK